MKLTEHLSLLTTSTPYAAATVAHPFITSAASLTLPKSHLALHLAQNHIYQAYPRFIAQLISKIPLEDSTPDSLAPRTLSTLVGCLNNAIHEFASFNTTAGQHELQINRDYWRERKGTRDYTAEMARVGALFSLEDGLVFLWAMEKVYMDAWSTIHTGIQSLSPQAEAQSQEDLTARALRHFSKSWSSATPEYVSFVNGIGELVDAYFAPVMADKEVAGQNTSEALARAEAIWARVVELTAEIWPNEGDEDTFLVSK